MLFSFICSSNNNIARIGGMLRARARYGVPLQLAPNLPAAAVDAATSGGGGGGDDATRWPSRITPSRRRRASRRPRRSSATSPRLPRVVRPRQRAARRIRGASWLKGSRRGGDPAAVRDALCTLPGVGPKVADCVALFSLDATAAIPVDIHVWQIACRDLDPTLSQALSLTPAVCASATPSASGGDHAGWAHSVLFAGELPLFRTKLPASVQAEIAAWKEQEKAAKVGAVAKRKAAREAKAEARARRREDGEQEAGARGVDRVQNCFYFCASELPFPQLLPAFTPRSRLLELKANGSIQFDSQRRSFCRL